MNTIEMIPVTQLRHHPMNPRQDMGDLTELTESIKSQGILQNLTIVPDDDGSYLVLIGNRRYEAAKLAGLEKLPCAVVEMDETDQIATMLAENMHRTDLTLYEQAQGVQMMMDLGLTEGQISEMTGFSRTTVRRRAEMARLDRDELKAHCAQLTMDDMDQLSRIRDIETRNRLLKEAGTGNFKWKTDNAIREEKIQENYRLVSGLLKEAGCEEKPIRGVADFWQRYEYLPYETAIDLEKYTPGRNVTPEDDRQLYFCMEYGRVRFWAEKRKAPEKEMEAEGPDEEELARKKEAEDAWQRLEGIEQHAKESREAFAARLSVKQKDSRTALDWLLIALVASNSPEMAATQLLPDIDEEQIRELPEGHTEADLGVEWIRGQLTVDPQLYAKVMINMFFGGEDCVRHRWQKKEKPVYCRNLSMITGYEWLAEFGYRASDDEKAYLDGTLDCYGEEEDE